MSSKDELLIAFDEAWSFKWESITTAISDVTDDEANFQHAAYADVEREEGHPPSGTILYFVFHLADCYAYYVSLIADRPLRIEIPTANAVSNMAEAIALLTANRALLREAVASLNEAQLLEPIFNHKTVAQLVRMSIRHDAWHSGQIALIRRLYRTR